MNQKGITLIALIITIVVLLILAGVTIPMLQGGDGIIAQAKKSQEAQENAQKNEEEALIKAESMIDQHQEGTLANEAHKGNVKIGDYVEYNFLQDGETSRTYKVAAGLTGDVEKTFTSNITKWQVLSVENGLIQLIADGVSDTGLVLYGDAGYLNGSKVLNEVCYNLYSGTYGIARSINLEDIKKATKIADRTLENIYEKNGSTYILDNDNTKVGDVISNITGYVPGGGDIKDVLIRNYTKRIYSNSNPNANNVALELIAKHTDDSISSDTEKHYYWLSDSSTELIVDETAEDKGQIKYCQYMIQGRAKGLTNIIAIARSHILNSREGAQEDVKTRSYFLRPVVTLKAGLTLDTSDPTKDGSTPEKAWIIKNK